LLRPPLVAPAGIGRLQTGDDFLALVQSRKDCGIDPVGDADGDFACLACSVILGDRDCGRARL
jgi:hypothetical protein